MTAQNIFVNAELKIDMFDLLFASTVFQVLEYFFILGLPEKSRNWSGW